MQKEVLNFENRTSVNGVLWTPRISDLKTVKTLSNNHNINPILSKILVGRNIEDSDVENFLCPKVNNLISNPSEIIDVDKGIDILINSIGNDETIGVIGDYDVDGATSSSLLKIFFNHYKINCEIYIPDRLKEGYGPNRIAFDQFLKLGIKTVITVDCGATAKKEIDYAKNLGIQVIVIDHHKIDEELPDSIAHINPSRKEDFSKLEDLAAIGLTFLFIVALRRALREENKYKNVQEPNLKNYLDIVALGTVCDVVQLKGLNRAFVKEGIKILNKNMRKGIKGLCFVSQAKDIGVYELGYLLGPRINAAGRTGSPDLGVRLLTSVNDDEVSAISEKLNDLNKDRQNIEKNVLTEAIEKVEDSIKQQNLNSPPVSLIVEKESWHLGVLGIVASRLKEKYNRPSFVISTCQNQSTGSGRSIPGIDIGKIILDAVNAGIIISGGGHSMAGGFNLEKGKLESFKKFCNEKILEVDQSILQKKNKYDDVLGSTDINRDFYEIIDQASPYGQGNSEPKFILSNIEIEFCQIVGKGHLKLKLSGRNFKNLDAIAFGSVGTPLGNLLSNHQGSQLHLAGAIRKNDWQGFKGVQFHVYDAFIA
mgnify:FL=1